MSGGIRGVDRGEGREEEEGARRAGDSSWEGCEVEPAGRGVCWRECGRAVWSDLSDLSDGAVDFVAPNHNVCATMAGLVIKPRSRILHGHDWVYSSEVLKALRQSKGRRRRVAQGRPGPDAGNGDLQFEIPDRGAPGSPGSGRMWIWIFSNGA